MSHIRIRKSGRKDKKGKFKTRYQAIINTYRNGRRFYKAKTFDTEREALAWDRETLTGIDTGLITKESLKRRKLSDAIEKYILFVLPHKPRNAKNVIHHLNWWGKHIGHLELTEVTAPIVAECRDRLQSEPSAKGTQRTNTTVVHYLASLSIVLEYCIKEWHWITHNPVRSIRKPPIGNGKTRFFTLEEIESIRRMCKESDSRHLFPIFVIALHTGMRKGELLSLIWSNIDLKNREILLSRSKNGEPRDIPMTEEVYNLLSDLSASKTLNIGGLLFPSPFNSKKPIDIRSAWERILRLAGIQGATFHTIRHTTCSFLANLGIPSIIIARIVGHKDSRTTDRYTHGVKNHLHDAINKLGDSLVQGKI
jgi:integrase